MSVVRMWESFTSFNRVTDMALYDGAVWVTTTGGLVRIDPGSLTYTTYTNIDGLGSNNLLCLCVDSKNRLWVGGAGRLVNFTDPGHPDGYLFTDRDGGLVEIFDIDCSPDGDSLWLANRLGLTIFLTSDEPGRGLILDTYSRFGDIARDTPARSVALSSDSIWVGTDGGFAAGGRFDVRLLKSPAGWVSYFPTQISPLSQDSIREVIIRQDTLYLGTTAGVYRFEPGPAPIMTSLGLFGEPLVYNMSLIGDSILVNTTRGSVFYFGGGFWGQPTTGMPIPNTAAGTVDSDGRYWDGNLVFGIYHREGDEMIAFDAGGTPANECVDIVRAQGRIWGAFAGSELAYQEGDRWIPVGGITGRLTALEAGPLGELWVATFGNGVYRVYGDSVVNFDETNSALSGLWNAPTFVVVTDIHNSGDAVWFANFFGDDADLAVVNPYNTGQWQGFLFAGGSSAEKIVTVTAEQSLVFAGSEENGIYVIDYRDTPFFPGDDIRGRFTSDSSGIGSDFIRVMEIDGYDTLWVGTAFGLSYQSLGEIYFVNTVLPVDFGPEISSLAFDGQGSLYAGSQNGLAIRDIATSTYEYLTSKNSDLAGNTVRNLYYDADYDAMWIMTTEGISRMTFPFRTRTLDDDEVFAYPNPFVIRHGTESVRFNYSGLAVTRIYTLAGELVREIPVTGRWDGRNAAGQLAASGVYIFTLTSPNDEVGRGKILLIRE